MFDAIYDPWPTPLAAAAAADGRPTVLNGLDLLAWQAVYQVELFTGRTVPVAVLLDAAHEALRRLAIDDLAERRLSRLSGGERQLVLIARALAQQARWVLLDEPTANLDIAHQARVLRELARLRDDGLGVLFSSHDPNHAARIADQVLMIREGRALACGPASGLLNARTLGELYGCPMLEVPGRFPAFFPA